jgi:hypothetical protein
MKQYDILVIGRGKLAREILDGLRGPAIARVIPWEERDSVENAACLVVHAGSGRELDDAVAFCSRTGSVLLELSTAGSPLPETVSFPVVLCPNVNMEMLSFMAMIKQSAGLFRGRDIRITESHQAAKKTSPGTAVHMARSLGVSEADIRSERNPQVQREELGIPSQYLDRHAYHEIVIASPEVRIRLETRVLGKSAYADGLADVIGLVAANAPAAGFHDIVDLVIENAPKA